MKKFIYCTIAALMCVACANDPQEIPTPNNTSDEAPQTLYAEFESPQSRTFVQNDKTLHWTNGDEISFFSGNYVYAYTFEGKTGDVNGEFSKITSSKTLVSLTKLPCNYATYPVSYSVTCTSGVCEQETTIPSTQKYVENSFGPKANLMVSVGKDADDQTLRFKNVCGYLKIQLYGSDVKVKRIELMGNNDEGISGSASLKVAYGQAPELTMLSYASRTVTIDCGDGVDLSSDSENPTAFWFVLPPVKFEKGFTIKVVDAKTGGSYEKSTSNPFTIDRNMIQPMAALEVDEFVVSESQKIYYTAESKITLQDGVFDVNVVSHTWNSTKGAGVITCDGPIKKIKSVNGKGAFSGSTLKSLTLPNSLTYIGGSFLSGSTLETITIPESVTSMDGEALKSSSLRKVFFKSTTPPKMDGEDSFSSRLMVAFVPIDAVDAYKTNWYFFEPDYVVGYSGNNQIIYSADYQFTPSSKFGGATITSSYWANQANIGVWTFDKDVTTIGEQAFGNKTYLNGIVIPKSVTTIEKNAFNGCTSLVDLTLSEELTTIGSGAFFNCSFQSVIIPSKVTSIGSNAFWGCGGNQNLYVYCKPTTPPTLEFDMFGDGPFESDVAIYVPQKSISQYRTAWSSYGYGIDVNYYN